MGGLRLSPGGRPLCMPIIRDSMMAQMAESLPAMWENWVRSLGRQDPLEKEMTTHSSILALNPMDGGAW